MDNAIAPPAGLKNKILAELDSSSAAKIVTMQPAPVKKLNWLKYAAAACVALLAGSIYLNVSLSNKNKSLQNNYNNTVAELSEIKKDIQILQANPNVKMASMKGIACFAAVLCYSLLGYCFT